MNISFDKRDFSGRLALPPLDFKVARYACSAIGGPRSATITATGDANDLWELIEFIRSPVKIYSDHGDFVWWGFVSEVELKLGRMTAAVSLDGVANRVAVVFSKVEEGETSGEQASTPWADHLISQNEYGIRELLYSTSGATEAHALAARAAILEQLKFPLPFQSFTGEEVEKPSATIYCRGWFDTLEWRYYQDLTTAPVDTAAQAVAIAAAGGQFFTAIECGLTSGIVTNPYRDGQATALYELSELLRMGTTNQRRMLANVDIGRRLHITEEPVNVQANTWLLTKDGELRDPFDTPVRKDTCPAGVWARLKDVIPGSLDTSLLADPTLMFVEESEYDVSTETLSLTPRNVEDPWNIGRPKDG